MNALKKSACLVISLLMIAACFSACSAEEKSAGEITANTMLIAYTDDNAPFIYEENGGVAGFDAEVFDAIFDSIKNDYDNYRFVKVDSDYKIGEDVYCTDSEGRECIAYIMAGGVRKNTGTINSKYSLSEPVITNRVITITTNDSAISSYNDLDGKTAGVIEGEGSNALDSNSAVKGAFNSITQYAAGDAATALADLAAGKTDALVIDEFSYNAAGGGDFKVLDGELDSIEYVYAFKKRDELTDAVNEAVYELKSKEYNDSDQFTPIVEKYFGYDASSFSYQSAES